MSAKTKFKLTAHEGCRVRKVALVVFSSVAQEDYSEHTLVCLTNLGDMHLFNIPGLRPQVGFCVDAWWCVHFVQNYLYHLNMIL